jgi:tetratricopeptide (TPR) repeat protein
MKQSNVKKPFIDSPQLEQLMEDVTLWPLPFLPKELKDKIPAGSSKSYPDISSWFRKKIQSSGCLYSREDCEETLINWLYAFIRLNIKRGPVFNLREVLRTGEADCLGYAKLFTTLGRDCGLDLGVVEVIIDNRGRNVSHTVTLVNLAGGGKRFVDFWYGSQNIRPKRVGLQVKGKSGWEIEDIDFSRIKKTVDISYLPDEAIDAVTLYIEGNRSLKTGNYGLAVEKYTRAAALYPQNARVYYNRAVAYEMLGEPEKAEADYKLALKDEAAIKRTLATQPQEVVDLMKLDEKFIPEPDQEIYLLHKGFITGRKVSPQQLALKCAMDKEEVEAVLSFIEIVLRKCCA